MENKNNREIALTNLINISSKKGFLLFDDIYNEADNLELSIKDVDYLSNSIVTRGVLIYDEAPITQIETTDEDDFYDYAQVDYNSIFRKVVELDPGLEYFINTVQNIIPPQANEMERLKYQVQEGNTYARERVIQMHLRYAVRLALQRTEIYDCEIADTVQEASIGLIKAVDKYNPDSGAPFGSGASIWILQNICRSQGTQRPLVYYPQAKKDKYFTMYPILKEQGYLETEKILTSIESRNFISDTLQCDSEEAEEIIRQSMPIESLDEIYDKLNEDIKENVNQKEYYLDISNKDLCLQDDFEKIVENRLLSMDVSELIKKLKPKEQEILMARYGFDDGVEKTLAELGRRMGVSRERIRQIEVKAIKKLRAFIDQNKSKLYYGI